MFRFIIKLSFDKKNYLFIFVMYFSTWNVNLFEVSNPFHVYNNDV